MVKLWKNNAVLWLFCAGIILFGIFTNFFLSPLMNDIFTNGCITLVMVLGLQLFMGNSGILNWSYMGFVAIGAFISGICSMPVNLKEQALPAMYPFLQQINLPFPVAVLVGIAVAVLFAGIISWPLMRLSDSAGVITQFALLIVMNVILLQWEQVTNGPRTFTMGAMKTTNLWIAMFAGIAVLIFVYFFRETTLGLKLRASREDRYATLACGINIVAVRYQSFLISAGLGALSGSLWSHYILSFTAKTFYMTEFFMILAMIIIGGSKTVTGVVSGCIIVTIVRKSLQQVEIGLQMTGMTEITLAIVMIVFLIWRPNGIFGVKEPQIFNNPSDFKIKEQYEKTN
ncbi:MAG: branched-chain amino acid ABC transporter permease [Bifidobacteriaceae bacterium]|jgi:branched-chain amino acid transport system permease protein|nr:branched-chain amino acid ABC transporter permease [Bifidobacteriaceae bacterium]